MLFVNNIKENAKKIINTELITHFCAVMFPFVCGLAFILAGVMLSSAVIPVAGEYVSSLILFLFFMFTVAMTIPLFYGLAVFESNCAVNGKSDFSDMFRGYCSAYLYFRSICYFYGMLWRFLLVFALPLILIREFALYTVNSKYSFFHPVSAGGYDITYTLLVILIIASVITSFTIYSKYIFASYFVAIREQTAVSDCFFAAKVYERDCAKELGSLASSFLPLLVLSVASFGIIAVYAVPFMLSAIYLFAHERYNADDLNSKFKDKLFAK